ncbi:MAG TPA: nucleoside 2-deoxyribosyltransferase [Bradyrhizobium sp.]|jgi:nucleoside 2-deoxyribosyltransferase|nr:nucleoside 2-deoxyribosyltransferase [Bradyrhizobium sp.]
MKTFDDQIADIEKLDLLRQRARTLRQEAIEALTTEPYMVQPRPDTSDEAIAALAEWNALPKRDEWAEPGDDVEKAKMLRALTMLKARKPRNAEHQEQSLKALIKDLGSIESADRIDTNSLDSIPILRCALILQALGEMPGLALSGTALACFYRIVQELNEVVGPTWASGAARADEESQATAFTTGECARALLALETALLQTATAAELLGKAVARQTGSFSEFNLWSKKEEAFRRYSLDISLAALPHLIVSVLTSDKDREAAGWPKQVLDQIAAALRNIPSAATVIGSHRTAKPTKPTDRMQKVVPAYLAETAQTIAANAVERLRTAVMIGASVSDSEELGRTIAVQLRRGAQIIRDLLSPVEQFAETVIDRQITAASQYLKVPVDGAELVFAATLLGLLTDWNRPKVRAAYEVLYPLLSANGRLLSIRPFDVSSDGYRLNVATLEVTRRLADLVANLDVEPEPEFVTRLMLPFEYTRVQGTDPSTCGWTNDPPSREPKSLWWLTAIALDALGSIVDMLDETINRRLLQHFHVRQPGRLNLALDDLFYPDFGSAALTGEPSIAVRLQQLRAHAGHGPPEKRPVYSLILYGPPGTGKTTLVEAVAKTAGVPLVEVTPSDILVGGAEGAERRARQVFQALSKLTHVVILFDEFDSILLDRAKRDPEEIPTSLIEFLTPGMLPKLKALNDASKEGRISYMLATNFVDRLDAAVTRGGRFDYRSGIYPPDTMSRLGRLLDQLQRLKSSDDKTAVALRSDHAKETDPDRKKLIDSKLQKLGARAVDFDRIRPRVLETVKNTRSAPMDKLGKPGWYSMPRDDKDFEETLFGYILTGHDHKKIQPEAVLQREADKYNEQRARRTGKKIRSLPPPEGRYWTEWKQIERWDETFAKSVDEHTAWKQIYEIMDGMLAKPSALRIYLAGPEVFLPDAEAVAKAKIKLCDDYGFIGVSPVDNELDDSDCTKQETALNIASANEEAIRNCDLVIANLTPFRGPSADVGTAYEIGFARTLGRPVFAYTNVGGSLLKRMQQDPGAGVAARASGKFKFEDGDHMAIEDFDGFDNLMLSGAIEGGEPPVVINDVARERRYSDLEGFEACLRLAATRFGVVKHPAGTGGGAVT